MRIYHPEYRITWADRLWDLFEGRRPAARPDGVDFTLVNRAAVRNVRDFLDQTLNISLIGDEMVRVDTAWRLPDDGEADVAEQLVARLRFGQVQPGGVKVPIPVRWIQFDRARHGTRVLLRLVQKPDPGLRSYLAGNFGEAGEDWEEYGLGEG